MLNYYVQQTAVELGWEFYGPVIAMLVLIALAVPVWVSLGIGSIALLYITEVLPLSLFGESLFDGIDAFALIAVPLFILTGDVLVRTGLSTNCSMSPKPVWAARGRGSAALRCWAVASSPVSQARMPLVQPQWVV